MVWSFWSFPLNIPHYWTSDYQGMLLGTNAIPSDDRVGDGIHPLGQGIQWTRINKKFQVWGSCSSLWTSPLINFTPEVSCLYLGLAPFLNLRNPLPPQPTFPLTFLLTFFSIVPIAGVFGGPFYAPSIGISPWCESPQGTHSLRDYYVQGIVHGMQDDIEENGKENLHPHEAHRPVGKLSYTQWIRTVSRCSGRDK